MVRHWERPVNLIEGKTSIRRPHKIATALRRIRQKSRKYRRCQSPGILFKSSKRLLVSGLRMEGFDESALSYTLMGISKSS